METSTNKVTDNNSNGSSTENDETKAIDSNVQVPVILRCNKKQASS